jgi:bromodomain-containing protein 8
MPQKSASPDHVELTNLESLLLSQAVYEVGAQQWEGVSALLTKHPMTKRPKNFWAPQVRFSYP